MLVDNEAGRDGRDGELLVKRVERSLLNGQHILSGLAEIQIACAGCRQFVIALDGGRQSIGRHADLASELFNGVGCVHTAFFARALQVLQGSQALFAHGCGLRLEVGIYDAQPYAIGLPFDHIVAIVEPHIFGAEALAIEVHGEKWGVAEEGAVGAPVLGMDHLRVTDVLHQAAGHHAHKLPVASFVHLFLLEGKGVRQVLFDHVIVILVIAGGDDNALGGIELQDGSVLAACEYARDSIAVFYQLYAGALVMHVYLIPEVFRKADGRGVHTAFVVEHNSGCASLGVLEHTQLFAIVRNAGFVCFLAVPGNGFGAVFSPYVVKRPGGAVRTKLAKRMHEMLGGKLVGSLGVQVAASGSLGDSVHLFLDEAYVCAGLVGGDGCGNAAGAGTDDDDVVGLLLVKLGDGRGLGGGAFEVRHGKASCKVALGVRGIPRCLGRLRGA